MTNLTVRRLLIDLETPISRHWNGGDIARTAVFNALSMSFPAGEKWFVDSLRLAAKVLPESQRVSYAAEIDAFIGQEANHLKIHSLFNAQLVAQGMRNKWGKRIANRSVNLQRQSVPFVVGVSACHEHLTAIFAHWIFEHPEALQGAEPHVRDMWHWHASEELEHRSTAFDIYVALGGRTRQRRLTMWFVTAYFISDLLRQTFDNLGRENALGRWHIWREVSSFLLGRKGMLRALFRPWRQFFCSGFHPADIPDQWSEQWLADHRERYWTMPKKDIEGQ